MTVNRNPFTNNRQQRLFLINPTMGGDSSSGSVRKPSCGPMLRQIVCRVVDAGERECLVAFHARAAAAAMTLAAFIA